MRTKDILSIARLLGFILAISYCVDKLAFFALNGVSDQVFSGQSIGKLNHYLSIKDNMDIIVFGSSRVYHHIDVGLMPSSAFNMGIYTQGMAYMATVLKTLPTDKEQLVIISIDPQQIFRETYLAEDILPLACKYHRNNIIAQELDRVDGINPLQRFYWSIAYNGKIIGIIKNFIQPKYDYRKHNGYIPLVLNEGQQKMRDKLMPKERVQNCPKNLTINDLSMSYLLEIKDFCNQYNKTLLVITSPVYFDDCVEDNTALAKLLAKRGFKYKDYTEYFGENANNSLWKDNTHLSQEGASIFSVAVAKWVTSNW